MNNAQPSLLVIIPTFNESENIGLLLDEVTKKLPTVSFLVVDDSSPDGTADVVRERMKNSSQIFLLSREKKDGLARAYLAGFKWGLDKGFDYLCEMDADFSHHPDDLAKIVSHIPNEKVIVGTRYIPGGKTSGWSWLRVFISRGGNLYAKTILNLKYQDLTGGFNCWSRDVLESIDLPSIQSKGYAFQVELKYRAIRKGFTIKEIPIHFRNRVHGQSKMSGGIVWEAAWKVFQLKQARI